MSKKFILLLLVTSTYCSNLCQRCVSTGKIFSINSEKIAFCSETSIKTPGFLRFVSRSAKECENLSSVIQRFKIFSVKQIAKNHHIEENTTAEIPTTTEMINSVNKISQPIQSQSTNIEQVAKVTNVLTTWIPKLTPNLTATTSKVQTAPVTLDKEIEQSIQVSTTTEVAKKGFAPETSENVPTLTTRELTMEPKTEFHTTEISTVRAQKFQQSTELTTKNFNLRHQFSDREPSFSTAVKEAKLWRALYRAYTLTSELGKLNRTTQAMKEFNNKNPFAFFNYPKQMMKLLTKNIL